MSVTRELVPEGRRAEHAAGILGAHFPLVFEPVLYSVADRLSPDYSGGYWHFYALSNGGFYMAPESESPFRVSCENGFEGTLSADAFGITSCLYAYSHLSFSDDAGLAEVCARQFHLLREHALDHPEAGAVMAAID